VCRQHAAAQEVWRGRVDRELKVAIERASQDSLLERFPQAVSVDHLDEPPQLAPRHEAQRYRGDETEETVSTNHQLKQLRVLVAPAAAPVPLRVQERERLDIADDGAHAQSAPMNVRRERAADAQPIRAGLLLGDGPAPPRRRLDSLLQLI